MFTESELDQCDHGIKFDAEKDCPVCAKESKELIEFLIYAFNGKDNLLKMFKEVEEENNAKHK